MVKSPTSLHVTSAAAKSRKHFFNFMVILCSFRYFPMISRGFIHPRWCNFRFSHHYQDANRQLLVGAAVEPKLPELDRVQSLVQAT